MSHREDHLEPVGDTGDTSIGESNQERKEPQDPFAFISVGVPPDYDKLTSKG